MLQEQLNKYIWIVDTLMRFKRLTRQELDREWKKSKFSVNDEGLPRRTFYNYRQAIEEVFGIEIGYDPATFEYYIDDRQIADGPGGTMINWLLNTASTNNVLSSVKDISDRIVLEDVPSAREFLSTVMEGVKQNHQIEFDYYPYTRSIGTKGVIVEPYFLNLFHQRWYMTGKNVSDGLIKTYALDRMSAVRVLSSSFRLPEDFDIREYSRDAFGVIFSKGQIHDIVLQVEPRRAKYLRTLPLHHSQKEELHDKYSLFSYHLRITPDLVSEILSMGPSVTVVKPPELKVMVTEELKKSLENYQ